MRYVWNEAVFTWKIDIYMWMQHRKIQKFKDAYIYSLLKIN